MGHGRVTVERGFVKVILKRPTSNATTEREFLHQFEVGDHLVTRRQASNIRKIRIWEIKKHWKIVPHRISLQTFIEFFID